MPKFTIRFACGATFGPSDFDPRDGERMDKQGRIRLAVFDSDSEIERPKLNDGHAPCRFACQVKARESGRKYTQCWPIKPGSGRWRHVVTCRGSVDVDEP